MTALAPTHGSQADVLVNGYVVSQYLNNFAWSGSRDKAEATAFKSSNKAYVAGVMDSVGTFGGLYDGTNSAAIDPLLYAAISSTSDNTWMYAPAGAQGSSAFGNAALSITAFQTKYEVKSAIAAANEITAEVQTDSLSGGVDHGFIYSPWATQGSSGNTASIDSGVTSTANGGVLIVHTFTDVSSLVVSLYDSADNSTFAAVTGYSITTTNSVQAAYRYPAAGTTPTGTVRRYTRINWTGTGTFLAFFSRK